MAKRFIFGRRCFMLNTARRVSWRDKYTEAMSAQQEEPPEVEKSILCQQSQSGACYLIIIFTNLFIF